MSIVYMEPFTQYGNNVNNMLNGTYASATGGYSFQTVSWDTSATISLAGATTTFGILLRRVLPATQTNQIVQFRFGVDSLPIGNNLVDIYDWRDSGNSQIAKLSLNSDGTLALKLPNNTVVAQTQGPVVHTQTLHMMEMQLDVSGKTFVLRVDDATGTGTPVINASSLSTIGAGPISQNGILPLPGSFPGNTPTPNCYFKDYIVKNTSGSVNNGFNGDLHVAALFADADTANAAWTPRFYHEFGPGILNLTSASACLVCPSSTSTDLGSADYTIEGWFRFQSLPTASGYQTLMSKWDTANNRRSYRFIYGGSSFNANCLQFDYCLDGTASTITTAFQYPWVPDTNRWYHIALVKASNQLLLFVDGNQLGLPIADAHTYFAGTEPLGIGAEIQGTSTVVGSTNLTGWMDETRLTAGFARYSAPFTPTGPFPRGSGSDAHWANVAFLAGYNSGIQDESGFARTTTAVNGAFAFVVADGPSIGSWSTIGVNKINPDDNSFLSAPFTAATGTLTMTVQPANNDTVTVGTKNGSTAAVYTFKTTIASAFDVLIDTTAQNTLLNLFNAINAGSGVGTKYGTGTTANFDVTAFQLPAGQLQMNANTLGTTGNSIATSATGTAASWGGTTLSGGANIPGPSDFKVQRPPPHTTVIAGVQLNSRMFKSDAGLCSVEMGLVGALGGVNYGAIHPLTTSPVYYGDIIETDPDTAGPISPTTIVNGALRFNRTA